MTIIYLVFSIYYYKTKLTFCSIFIRILNFFLFTPPLQFYFDFFKFFLNFNNNILIYSYFCNLFLNYENTICSVLYYINFILCHMKSCLKIKCQIWSILKFSFFRFLAKIDKELKRDISVLTKISYYFGDLAELILSIYILLWFDKIFNRIF